MIRAIVDDILNSAKIFLFPNLQRLLNQAAATRGDASATDSWPDELADISAAMRSNTVRSISDPNSVAALFAKRISDLNLADWKRAVKHVVGVDLFANEPWLRDELSGWARENANLISGFHSEGINTVSILTQRGVREGRRYEEIAKEIRSRLNVSKNKAELWARDQTAKLNSDLTKRRSVQAGVSEYDWATSNDERVRGLPGGKYPDARPRHDVMAGLTCRWDDPSVYKDGDKWVSRSRIGGVDQHPGKDYNCRCAAIPRVDKLLEALR
jgi:SPP1 gp7 family putative phage head morphogenesis protein